MIKDALSKARLIQVEELLFKGPRPSPSAADFLQTSLSKLRGNADPVSSSTSLAADFR
jgi:hypothetical protein